MAWHTGRPWKCRRWPPGWKDKSTPSIHFHLPHDKYWWTFFIIVLKKTNAVTYGVSMNISISMAAWRVFLTLKNDPPPSKHFHSPHDKYQLQDPNLFLICSVIILHHNFGKQMSVNYRAAMKRCHRKKSRGWTSPGITPADLECDHFITGIFLFKIIVENY